MLIDAHVHLYPDEVNRDPAGWAAAKGETHWAIHATRRRKSGQAVQGFPSATELLRAMDSAGVAKVVLLGWYWEHFATCAEQNRFFARCVKSHPNRFAAFATLHPSAGREAVLAELKQARDEGLCGLGELSPHSQGYTIDDPVFRAALTWAASHHWPVNLHVTDPSSKRYIGWIETPLEDFTRLARELPQVTFVLAHWGGLLPLRDTAALQLTNLHYDTAASPLLYDETVWRRFFAVVPADKVLFGSDFPLNCYPRIDAETAMPRLVAEAHRAGLDASQLRALTSENAKRVLKI